ncbi:MAG: hypothetical protein Kow0099_36600 [Candidatus Abyssubacteria bacterium]
MGDSKKLHVIVAAGDRGKSHPVLGRNKAFLEVQGLPIITRVVKALDESQSVSEIYIVGPKTKLEEFLSPERGGPRFAKPIHVFEQRSTLYENIWHTFLETLPEYRQGMSVEEIARGPSAETVVLVVASDMPLLTATEVDEFVSRCDMNRYDYIVGLTRKEDLKHYYPSEGKPGIKLAYMHFREGSMRQNNMHMVRPFRIQNRHYAQTLYDLRYQKEFVNIVRLAWEILKTEEGGWGALGYYLMLQLSLLCARLHLIYPKELVRKATHAESVAHCISKLMKARFGYALTTLGGAALDVDKEHEYEAIKVRYSEWMNYLQEKAEHMQIRSGQPHFTDADTADAH